MDIKLIIIKNVLLRVMLDREYIPYSELQKKLRALGWSDEEIEAAADELAIEGFIEIRMGREDDYILM